MTDSNQPNRDARLEDLVSRALDLPLDERDAFLVFECGDDLEFLNEARSWLESSELADTGFLAPPKMARGAREAPAVTGDQALVLGDYEILEQIGGGGMARVYRGRSRRTGQVAAIKIISAHAGISERHLERFHRESLNQGRLKHPGIVPVFADGQQDQWHWIAQELVEGHDLERELRLQRREPMPNDPPNLLPRPGEPERVSKVVEIIAQAAEALDHAHQHGVVHRDVKPSNLLLRPSGRVLLADFGLSRDEAMGSLTRTGEVAGSLPYMSPEQTRSLKDRIDHRTDIYSLGVVLYELLALRRPFEAGTSVELIKRISEGPYRPLRSRVPDVPEPLEIIVDRALSRNPEQRFATMAEFAEDLRLFQRGKPIHSRKPTRGQRFKEWAYRNRRWLPDAVLIAILSSLGAIGALTLNQWQDRARVRVTMAGGSASAIADADPESYSVGVHQLDPMTDAIISTPERNSAIGDTIRLDPGHYMFEFTHDGVLIAQLRRELASRQEVTLELGPMRAPRHLDRMVAYEGGLLQLRDEGIYERVALEGLDVPIEPFLLDRTEVSNADYRVFLEETDTRKPEHWDQLGPEDDDLPVVGVTWFEARSYAEWCGKRLPTLGEWLWAARGPEGRIVPWTAEADWEPRGNILAPLPRKGLGRIPEYLNYVLPVSSNPDSATPEGVLNLFGNVMEFTATCVFDRGDEDPSLWREFERARYVAGGAWWEGTDPEEMRDLRNSFKITTLEAGDRGAASNGFRCARSIR